MSFLLVLLLCQSPAAKPAAPSETAAEEFLRIGKELYANENPFIGAASMHALEKALEDPALETGKRVELLMQLGKEYLKGTEVERAIATMEKAVELSGGASSVTAEMHRQLGLAYLRQAEQENCVRRHNAECCIFPLEGRAIHEEREPAEKSREHYRAVLEATPDDRDTLWLLNITAMALGEYPESVPERWRLPEQAFESQAEFPRFHDIAPELGVDILNMAGGVAVEDYDGDGWLDVLTSTCDPLGPLTYFHNEGDGSFSDRSKEAHTDEQLGGLKIGRAHV